MILFLHMGLVSIERFVIDYERGYAVYICS